MKTLKNILAALVAAVLCLTGFALAETEGEAAAIDRFSDTWVADGIAVEIWHADGEFHCHAVFGDGGDESETWEYSACWYNAEADAIACGGVIRHRDAFDAERQALVEVDRSMDDLNAAEFTFRDGKDELLWRDDGLEEPVALRRLLDAGGEETADDRGADSAAAEAPYAGVDTSDWQYYSFEGSGVAMKLPADFASVSDAPEEGVFYDCGNGDVVLQVTPVDGDFADREALAAYYNGLAYIEKAELAEINGVELVAVEGGDDNVTACAVISAEGTVYQFAFFPQGLETGNLKGIEVAEAMKASLCPSDSIPAGGKVIAPMAWEIDLAALADGAYPAAFDPAALSGGVLDNVRVFTEDCYDIVDVATLAVGDYIVFDGQTVAVEALDRAGDVIVNGGLEGDGFVLRAYDEDNCYKVAGFDDLHTYTAHGAVALPLDADVAFTDAWDIAKAPVTVKGAAAVEKAIAESGNDQFDPYNTTVVVESGRVVEINRAYVP